MVKKDFYNTKELIHKPDLKFGDDSEFILELTNKIYEEVAYQISI